MGGPVLGAAWGSKGASNNIPSPFPTGTYYAGQPYCAAAGYGSPFGAAPLPYYSPSQHYLVWPSSSGQLYPAPSDGYWQHQPQQWPQYPGQGSQQQQQTQQAEMGHQQGEVEMEEEEEEQQPPPPQARPESAVATARPESAATTSRPESAAGTAASTEQAHAAGHAGSEGFWVSWRCGGAGTEGLCCMAICCRPHSTRWNPIVKTAQRLEHHTHITIPALPPPPPSGWRLVAGAPLCAAAEKGEAAALL